MRNNFLVLLLLFITVFSFAQDKKKPIKDDSQSLDDKKEKRLRQDPNDDKTPKATIDMYKIITIERDTIVLDTSLTIQKEYKFNYLRKDIFGLLPFANEGQTYTTLNFGLQKFNPFPVLGFKAKHFSYLEVEDIDYYSVATPLSDLYFKTVMEQGQSLDAFITLNTSERLNFSIAYKGLRSLGKYVNQLSSAGNFRFTTSYNTKNNRYFLKFHFTGQDILNNENGGIISNENFESGDAAYSDRKRLETYLTDANSFLKGSRFFINHSFRINKNDAENNLLLTHELNYEHKFFEYNQTTLGTTIDGDTFNRFGDAYVTSGLKDQTRYDKFYNKVGAIYENKTLGEFQFYIDDFYFNQKYNRIIISDDTIIPNIYADRINSVGAQYRYQKNNWKGRFLISNAVSKQDFSNLEAEVRYKIKENNTLSFQYQKINRIPNQTFNFFQSNYINYNWFNTFKNEKINAITVDAKTSWFNAAFQFSTLNDFLYFSNDDSSGNQLLVTPKQYENTVTYLSVKASKEIKFWRLALDNTVLFQEVSQNDAVLNVPQIVTRNSLYYTGKFFKKALFLQTGFTLNYFTSYKANEYNPVIGDFFVQNQKEIGNFPMVDFFINAKIQQARIFLKAEHFNSSFSGNNFYTSPNYPYRDFMIRFGIVWNFFQ